MFAWLSAILRNNVLDIARSYAEAAKRHVGREERLSSYEHKLLALNAQPETEALRREQEELLRQGLATLDETARRLLHLCFGERRPRRQIGQEMGFSKDKARRIALDALAELQDWMLGERPKEQGP